jgi:hypothetical protein
MRRGSTVSTVTEYGLDDRAIGVRVPVELRMFTSPLLQTGSGIHTASCPVGNGFSFHGGKEAGS